MRSRTLGAREKLPSESKLNQRLETDLDTLAACA